MRACRKLNYAHDEEDLAEMACPYFLLSRYDFFVNKGIRTSSDHTSMDGLEAGPARLFFIVASL